MHTHRPRRTVPACARAAALCALFLPLALSASEAAYRWVEGEAAERSNAEAHPWYSRAIKQDMLSDNAFLSHFVSSKQPAEAHYTVELPRNDTWTLWARMNPTKATASYRLDGGDWQPVDFSTAIDKVNIAADGKPDLRYLGWIQLFSGELEDGKHRLAFRFHSRNHAHGALDCFVFTAVPFLPDGTTKPGATGESESEPGHFACGTGVDPFADDALIDLRERNEQRAGEHGPLRREGDDFVRADGTPIRFWAANAGPAKSQSGADYLARRLAKLGYNMGRMHGLIARRDGSHALDPDKRDRVFYQVKAFADAGIYTHLSTYFPLWYRLQKANDIPGGRLGERPFALLMFEPAFQEMYKDWLKELLTTENPYTGRTLAEDPAVGIVEIQNEDGFFFYTFTRKNVGEGPWRRLERRFGTWAAQRYGNAAKAVAAWGRGHDRDDPGSGHLALHDAWFMTRDANSKIGEATQRRIRDQIRFLGELQHAFYADMTRYIKQELGYRGLVSASNWTTADNGRLLGIERWSYTATDVIDRHGYFGCPHEGEGSNYSVRVGHEFADRAAVRDPAATPLGYLQIAGRPHIHSEIAWNKPNRYNADHQLLIAAYGALQGTDGFFIFSTHQGTWNKQATAKWPVMTPGVAGQSPAAALLFRRRDVSTSDPVVRQVTDSDDLLALRTLGVVEGANDDFRLAGRPDAADPDSFDPLTWFVGRAERVITDIDGAPRGARPSAVDLSRHIDRRAKTVTSVDDSLRWDWGRGVVTIDTPRCQAATGFLAKAGTIALGDCTITCENPYASVCVISLDDRPLRESRRILVQAFTAEHLSGFAERDGTITDLGGPPYQVPQIAARVVFARGGFTAATRCDAHGYADGEAPLRGDTLALPADALYTVLTR